MRFPVDVKMNAHSVCVSGDGRFVAWLERDGKDWYESVHRLGVMDLSSGDTTAVYLPHRIHAGFPEDGSMLTDMGFELHACEFLPGGHVVTVLTSDGIVQYDCDLHTTVRDVKEDHGWRRTRTQHTDIPDYHPQLAVDPGGRFLATISEEYPLVRVRIWDQNTLGLLYSTTFDNGEDLAFVKNDGIDALAIYDGGWSTRGIHYLPLLSRGTMPDGSVPYSRDFFLTATNRIVHEDLEYQWYYEDEFMMIVKPFLIAGTDIVFGKQKGYDDIIYKSDEHEETIGDFISPEMEWLYGYDSQHHAYMVLLRDETILHSDSALNVLAADNGDMITVFYRSPGYEIAKNDGDLKRFFRGLVLGQ